MMYEKLVNRLRKASGPAIDFPDTLYDEAADAIEKLWNEVKAHRMRYGWIDSEDGGRDDV